MNMIKIFTYPFKKCLMHLLSVAYYARDIMIKKKKEEEGNVRKTAFL